MDKQFAAGYKRFEGQGRDFTCAVCGWYRDVRTDEHRFDFIQHPQWGKISWVGAAKRDIDSHDCETYQTALQEVRSHFLKEAS